MADIDAQSTSPLPACALLPTTFGEFRVRVYCRKSPVAPEAGVLKEHVSLTYGNVTNASEVLVRVHSECITGEVFNSLKCDCKLQLDTAMAEIAREGAGVIIYLRQEGRGIGLFNKIRAYQLQELGHDTVEANRLLGLPDDARTYEMVPEMLEHLKVASVRLMTNNPSKVSELRKLGVDVVSRQPIVVKSNIHSEIYLETKRIRMGHTLPELIAAPNQIS